MKKILFVPATVVALSFAFGTATASAADKKEGAEPKAGSVEEQDGQPRQADRHPQHQEGRQGAGAEPDRRRSRDGSAPSSAQPREGTGTKEG